MLSLRREVSSVSPLLKLSSAEQQQLRCPIVPVELSDYLCAPPTVAGSKDAQQDLL
jgi:hypothetical protein